MAKLIATVLGLALLLIGAAGFALPGLLGAHLSPAHNIIHLISGAVALYFGTRTDYFSAQRFCIAFAVFYGLLGVAGLIFGHPGTASLPPMEYSKHLLAVMPHQLELGGADHAIHLVLAALFALGGFSKPRKIRDKVSSVLGKAKASI